MKYPIILKYQYSYIISGNYYKRADSEYYQLFENENEYRMVSLEAVTDKKVDLIRYSDNEIEFSYKYIEYLYPNKFIADTKIITKTCTLKPKEKVSIDCVETYWAYARGAENGIATLTVEWISYEDMLEQIINEAKDDKYKAIRTAKVLIDEKMYDLAFNMLLGTQMYSYQLGLCYENGYGTDVDLDKALDNYLESGGYDSERGIERIFDKRGKKIKFDEVKKTIIYLKKGKYQKAYSTSIIPTEISDNKLEDLRKNVELSVVIFLELGRPSNDPFQHPTDDMSKLATYYDIINNIPENDRPVYHKIEWESDPYDGGEFRHDIYNNELIVETLQKEAKKNDVIALGTLLIQYGIHPHNYNFSSYLVNNIDEIIQRLLSIAENGNENESGMAYYFLGLYYERVAKKAHECYDIKYHIIDKTYTYTGNDIEKDLDIFLQEENIDQKDNLCLMIQELDNNHHYLSQNAKGDVIEKLKKLENFIIYLYDKNYEVCSKIEKDNLELAIKYFEISLKKEFYLSVAHLTEKIVKENPDSALKILSKYEKYVPYIRYSNAGKYHELLNELKEK